MLTEPVIDMSYSSIDWNMRCNGRREENFHYITAEKDLNESDGILCIKCRKSDEVIGSALVSFPRPIKCNEIPSQPTYQNILSYLTAIPTLHSIAGDDDHFLFDSFE